MDEKENENKIEDSKTEMNCWEALSTIVGYVCFTVIVVAVLIVCG